MGCNNDVPADEHNRPPLIWIANVKFCLHKTKGSPAVMRKFRFDKAMWLCTNALFYLHICTFYSSWCCIYPSCPEYNELRNFCFFLFREYQQQIVLFWREHVFNFVKGKKTIMLFDNRRAAYEYAYCICLSSKNTDACTVVLKHSFTNQTSQDKFCRIASSWMCLNSLRWWHCKCMWLLVQLQTCVSDITADRSQGIKLKCDWRVPASRAGANGGWQIF